jgi:hypothetical protein
MSEGVDLFANRCKYGTISAIIASSFEEMRPLLLYLSTMIGGGEL